MEKLDKIFKKLFEEKKSEIKYINVRGMVTCVKPQLTTKINM